MDAKPVLDVQVVHGDSESVINGKLMDLVSKGYIPLGGASISSTVDYVDIVQTMVLYNPDK